MATKLYTTEEVYDVVTFKGYEVDYPDGSCDAFKLMAYANGLGYKEVAPDTWIKERE
jgi:hypothetical protein